MNYATEQQINDILDLARRRRDEIRATESCYPEGRTTYYVDSQNGQDSKDGLSPETAWRSLERVAHATLSYGDVVLFRRGCIFRGTVLSQNGVTYSAYGEGEKPKFYGSIDASSPQDWVPTQVPNVWLYRPMIAYVKEVGSVIINGGKLWGIKICTNKKTGERCDMQRGIHRPMGELDVFNGRAYVHRERGPFGGLEDIKGDLEFFHNYFGIPGMIDDHLYLNCPDGNPGEVFESIELSLRYSVFNRGSDVTFDNLCVKNAGVHGISHRGNNITIRNCEFGFLGGSGMFPEQYGMKLDTPYGDDTTRLGNGVEVYGTCDNYIVENCYFEQIYDVAITAQVHRAYNGTTLYQKNIKWNNNVFYKCYNSFELWLNIPNNDGTMGISENIEATGNITVNGGYGWSHQRPDPYYSEWLMWGKEPAMCTFKNCCVHDNIFLNSKKYIIASNSIGPEKVRFENNTILHAGPLGHLPKDLNPETPEKAAFEANDENLALMEEKGIMTGTKFYKLTEEQSGIKGFNPPYDL